MRQIKPTKAALAAARKKEAEVKKKRKAGKLPKTKKQMVSKGVKAAKAKTRKVAAKKKAKKK